MKVIALIPAKNESWILRFTLTNLSAIADKIILLDDSSTDDTVRIAKEFPSVSVLSYPSQGESFTDMSARRNHLLKEGRKREGTHFICLDADESFSSTFLQNAREQLEALRPGQALCLPWIFVHQNKDRELLYNRKDRNNLKDFIFCDSPDLYYPDTALSEPRTPVHKSDIQQLTMEHGFVLHFQNLAAMRNQFKQAWYRMNEFVEGKRAPIRINATYDHTKSIPIYDRFERVADSFTKEHFHLINQAHAADTATQTDRIDDLFTRYGVEFFEPLDIWHLQTLYDRFVKETGREPRPSIAPGWLLMLNRAKNFIRNKFRS